MVLARENFTLWWKASEPVLYSAGELLERLRRDACLDACGA
jgi:hypothetical protein